MAETRKDQRAPASLRVKYKSATVDQFIEQSGSDISAGGIFVKTKKPLAIGTLLKFEFQLSDASPVMSGVGRVAWRREKAAGPGQVPGMGLKFLKLDADTRGLVERVVDSRLSGSSRFEQIDGAEVAPEGIAPVALGPTSGRPAGVSGPAPAPSAPRPGAAGAFGASMPPRGGAPAAPPAPSGGGAVAGLFGSSIAPGAPAASGSSSFFPSEAARDPVADASEFLASAFNEAGASDETTAEAELQAAATRQYSSAPPAASGPDPLSAPGSPFEGTEVPERSPLDDLWDEVASDSTPPPAAPSAAPSGVSSIPPSSATSEPPAAFGSSSAPPDAGPGSVPSGPPGLGAEMFEGLDLNDADSSFGEADLSASIPPAGPGAPVMTSSNAPPPAAPAPLPAAKGGGGAGLAIGVVVLLAALGGGYFFAMQQGLLPAGLPGVASQAAGPAQPEAPAEVPSVPVKVRVTSEPRAARVLVGGELKGETPVELTLPSARKTELTFEFEGYQTLTQVVEPQDPPSPEHFELSPLPFEIEVVTTPPGAEVSAEGVEPIVAPGVLQLGHIDGTATISAVKDGYRRTSRPIRMDAFNQQGEAMHAKLEIELSALPAGAKPAVPPPDTASKPRPRRKPKPKPKAEAEAESSGAEALPDNPF